METTIFDYLREYITTAEWCCVIGHTAHLDPSELIVNSVQMLTFCTEQCYDRDAIAERLLYCESYDIFSSAQAKKYLEPTYSSAFEPYQGLAFLVSRKRPLCFIIYYMELYDISPGDDFNGTLCTLAAEHGHLDFLVWLQDPTTGNNAHVWDEWILVDAIKHGHFHILRYMQYEADIWREILCVSASQYKHFAILRWLRSPNTGQGTCPWNRAQCLYCARKNNDHRMIQWIERQPE